MKKPKASAKHASSHNKRRIPDPRGGLTAAGRREFLRKEGAHLKPGVKKPLSEMSPEEMKRKGSWAVRFYGRSGALPPLRDNNGKPTRVALTASAWGEPVPRARLRQRVAGAGPRETLAQPVEFR